MQKSISEYATFTNCVSLLHFIKFHCIVFLLRFNVMYIYNLTSTITFILYYFSSFWFIQYPYRFISNFFFYCSFLLLFAHLITHLIDKRKFMTAFSTVCKFYFSTYSICFYTHIPTPLNAYSKAFLSLILTSLFSISMLSFLITFLKL